MSLAWSMDKIGPMGRTARDCEVVLGALAGADPDDASTVAWSYRRMRRRTFTLGVLPEDFTDLPDVERAFSDALRVLRATGVRATKIELPKHDFAATARAILAGEQAAAHEDFIKSARIEELVDEGQKEGLRSSLQQPNIEYVRAAERRVAIARDLRALFRDVDALVGPTLVAEAPTLDTDLRQLRRGIGPAVFGALAGLPAISVPMGFGSHGMPLGLSFTGDLFGEPTIVAIASAYQRETDWHVRRPSSATQAKTTTADTRERPVFSGSR
jgi:aspartyl-tRNA(Asn)/glutamyl-tRNA(Gln) amidotransferase subunit A